MNPTQQIESYKAAAAHSAALYLLDGMVVGLGSGSTAEMAVAAIGKRVQDGLRITGLSTSEKTSSLAREWKIPLSTLEEFPSVDVTIDGADEIEIGTLNLIKGGGGNLLREKLIAIASLQMIIVSDEKKLVDQLGAHAALSVEIVPFGWKTTEQRLQDLGATTTLRLDKQGQVMLTDGGHYVLDCLFGRIENPAALQSQLDHVVGVVEHGLFLGIACQAFVGGPGGVNTLKRLYSVAPSP